MFFGRRRCAQKLNSKVTNSFVPRDEWWREGGGEIATAKKRNKREERSEKKKERNKVRNRVARKRGEGGGGPSAWREDFNRLVHVVFPERGNLRAP